MSHPAVKRYEPRLTVQTLAYGADDSIAMAVLDGAAAARARTMARANPCDTRVRHIESANFGALLTVVDRVDVDLDECLAQQVWATADGRHVNHEAGLGDGDGDPVYFESFRADGSAFHGFVDSDSRQIVQVG